MKRGKVGVARPELEPAQRGAYRTGPGGRTLAWATAQNVNVVQLPHTYMYFKWITLQGK